MMSLAAKALPLSDIISCPATPPFVTGKQYEITGIVQGTLGTYSVIARALSATELDTNVTVLTNTGSHVWRGRFDFTTCQLTRLEDEYDNRINGSGNISLFPWFNGISVNGNSVEDISSFLPNAGIIFQNVTIKGASSLDLSLQTGTVVLDSVSIEGSSALTFAGSSDITITHSYFNATNLASNNAGDIVLLNVIDNASNWTVDGSGQHEITNSLLNSSTVTLNQGANFGMDRGLIHSSQINLLATLTGAFFLRFNSSTIINGGILTNVATALAANTSLANVHIERGTFNANQFGGSNMALLNATTTLAGATLNAKKDGYVNALP